MTDSELREQFADLLRNTKISEADNRDVQIQKYNSINGFITSNMPSSLIRYRSAESHNILALRNGVIPVTKPSKQTDRFDALIAVDKDKIKQQIANEFDEIDIDKVAMALFSGETIPQRILDMLDPASQQALLENVKRTKGNIALRPMMNIYAQQLRDSVLESIDRIEDTTIEYLKEIRYMACFCESATLVDMWDRYAGAHTGFALEYDFTGPDLLCRKQHPDCKNLQMQYTLFPIVYGEAYDATDFGVYQIQSQYFSSIAQGHLKFFDWLFYIKGYAYKNERYRPEGEWRLISHIQRPDYVYQTAEPYSNIPMMPKAIYYGSYMDPDIKSELAEIAKTHSLSEYQMVFEPLTMSVCADAL